MAQLIDVSIFKRNRSYALLYSGQFISFVGTMITMVALPFQVYAITHNTVLVGLLSLVQLCPLLFTALIGGVLADRYARRQILMVSEVILAGCCILLVVNAWSATPSVLFIFIVASMMSALTGFHRPAFEGVIQQLVQNEDYKTVGALRTLEYSFCMIAAPAIAGMMIAAFGIGFAYCIDFFTYFGSFIALVLLGTIPKPKQKDSSCSVYQALKEGGIFAWSRQVLWGSYCVDFIAMVFAIPNALFPAIAMSLGGAKTLGFLYAAPAVGSLIMAIGSGWTASIQHEGRAIAIAAILWGIAIIGFGLSHSLYLSLFCLVLSGAFDSISGIFRVSLWNHTIPQDFRGRLAGIEMLSYLSGPKLGDMRAGMMAATLGIELSIITGGCLCVIGVMLCCYKMREFWHFQNMD